jgi:hypothetical protein
LHECFRHAERDGYFASRLIPYLIPASFGENRKMASRLLCTWFGLTLVLLASSMAQAQGLLERLEKRLEGVLNEGPTPPAAAVPVAEPGYLGMVGDNNDPQPGVRVLTVRPDSPAEAAGLREGDVVVSVGGVAIANLDDLERQLAGKTAGTKLDLKIQRGEATQSLTATLARPPAAIGAPPTAVPSPATPPAGLLPTPRVPLARPEEEPRFAVPGRASLGVTVLPVTEDARRRYRLTVRQGALISSISPGSAADQAGLPIGAVVVAAEGRRIERPDDLIDLIQAAHPGDEVMLSYYQGGTLYRKTVRLGQAAGEAHVVPEEPIVREGDRPLLRRLERALDAVPPVERPAGIPLAPREATAGDLRAEVERLRARVDALERRLEELENRPAANRVPPPRPEPPKLEPPAAKKKDAEAAEESALELKPPTEPPPAPTPEPR